MAKLFAFAPSQRIRTQLGLAPEGYLGCVVDALAQFFADLASIAQGKLLDTIPQDSAFTQEDYRKYREAKKKKRDEKREEKKKSEPVPTFNAESPLRDYLKQNISSERGLMTEVTRTFGGSSQVTENCYNALSDKKNGIFTALMASLAEEHWDINDERLSHIPPSNYYGYEQEKFATKCVSSIKDGEFREMTDAIMEAAKVSVKENLSQDARWVATLFAAEDIFRQGIARYHKRKGETEEYEDGSDSENEEDGLYHRKLISQNGMNAIGLALAFARLWIEKTSEEPVAEESVAIFMEEMYYEASDLLMINNWLKKTTKLEDSVILMGDLNHCVTSLEKMSKYPIQHLCWRKKRVVIVDVTSSTLQGMNEVVEKFKRVATKGEPKVLILVSSGLKHEQLGTDKNAYGTVRFFVARERREALCGCLARLKTTPAYEKQAIVSHSVRRAFKRAGAVPTIQSILKPPTAHARRTCRG